MKKIIYLLVLTMVVSNACSKLDIEKGTPKCVENKIRDFDKSACADGANVKEYSFQSNTVYVFYQGTCGADLTTEVIDADCNSLGFLGGIAGNTKINGEEFSNASFVKIIWEK